MKDVDPAVRGRLASWALRVPTQTIGAGERSTLPIPTDRERQIAELAGEGLPDREFANALGISPRTAQTQQTHLGRVYSKLGVHRQSDITMALNDVSAK